VVDSNSLVSGFRFNQSAKSIGFNVSSPSYRAAFCNSTFPSDILGGPYTVFMNGSSVTAIQKSNATHTSLYFTYDSSHSVKIVGTTVVPEFPSLIAKVLVLAILGPVLIVRKKIMEFRFAR
jgi:hypothetical protein